MSDVLVVEDSAVDRRLVSGLLQREGHQVREAAQGEEALQLMEQQPAELVVADIIMPTMDGLELVERMRESFPLVPVILMTSQGNEQVALRALRKGAASYVPKRLLADELLDTVQHVMGLSSGQHHHSRVMQCMDQIRSEFRLDNDCQLVTPLVGYFQQNITHVGLCGDADRTRLGIALEEALVNAIYHGNLEVSSELRETDDVAYRALIEQRRLESPYRERRVHVTAEISRDRAEFVITDQGPGFDPHSLPDPTDPANLDRVCGRGVLLMRTFMNEVVYNDSGNQVMMVKHRCPDEA